MTLTNWYAIAPIWKQAEIGESQVVTDVRDLQQCIETILKTYPGQDSLRPFGSRIADHIDLPIDVARPLIIRDAAEAIALWEPRVKVSQIAVTPMTTMDGLTLVVYWLVVESTITGQNTLTLRSAIK